ncbi:MAG: hypothetical protein JNJ88_13960 [Planctomycetes bacterium]|nr:hypothetical protein [Planctomycetota bacterium]
MPASPQFSPFRPEDFRLYEPQNRSDETLNPKRLVVRQRLQAIGEAAKAALAEEGLGFERRESLHHPFSVNHFRVVAQWTSLFRDAKARKEFARAVGPDLGKDVDPGHANAALFASIDDEGITVGLRVGVEAWYDAQNLTNRCGKSDPERRALVELLRSAPGFLLRIHDWEKRYPTESISRDGVEEVLKYFQPGKHQLRCYRAIPKADPASTSAEFLGTLVEGMRKLAPLYRFIAWSPGNNWLLKGSGGFAS